MQLLVAVEKRSHARLVHIEETLATILARIPVATTEARGSSQQRPSFVGNGGLSSPHTLPLPPSQSTVKFADGNRPLTPTGSTPPASIRSSAPLTPTTASVAESGPASPGVREGENNTGLSVRAQSSADEVPRMRGHGTLTIHIKSASNLIKADFAGLSDPYVNVTVAGQPSRRSKTIKKTLDPTWDEKIDFEGVLEVLLTEPLVLNVFDQDFGVSALFGMVGMAHNKANNDDKLGKVVVSMEALHTENNIEWNDIKLEGVKTGMISFSATWAADHETDGVQVRALVERDPEIRAMLREVRKQMDAQADKTDHRLQNFREGTNKMLRSKSSANLSATTSVKLGQPGALRRQDSKNSVTSQGTSTSDGTDNQVVRLTPRRLCRFCCGPVLDPNSRFRTVWNIFLAMMICYCGIQVPLEIAFETDMVDSMCTTRSLEGVKVTLRAQCVSFQLWFWYNFIVDLFFISDIVINLRTGYVKEGHFVNDDWLAAKNYLKGSFFIDVLGSFPLTILLMMIQPDNPYGDVIEDQESVDPGVGRVNRMLRLLRLAKLAKLFRMAKLAKYLSNFEEFLNPGVLAVVKLGTIALMCCHWFGCLWWLISDLELSEKELESPWYAGENSWHPPIWLREETSLFTKYMHSFFWGAGMVTSMVPRDIEPVTSIEALVTTFTMFFGLLLNAFVISSLTAALASMNSKKELAGKQLDTIRNYLLVKAVPADLRSRILEYYEYLFTSSQSLASSVRLEEMPVNLSAQLALSMNRKLAAKCSFFREISNACMVTLMSSLVPRVFVPGQLIVFEGHSLTEVYFINRGHVQLLERTINMGMLRDNDNFGLDDFLQSCIAAKPPVVRLTAKAVTYCDVSYLSVESLSEALAQDETFQVRIRTGELGEKAKKATKNKGFCQNLKRAGTRDRGTGSCVSEASSTLGLRETSPALSRLRRGMSIDETKDDSRQAPLATPVARLAPEHLQA